MDEKFTVLNNLNRPHGIAFYNGKLYVAQETEVDRYFYNEDSFTAVFDKKLFSLPKGGRHFTRGLVFDKKGNLYTSLGSTCDTCLENNPYIASVLISDSNGANLRTYSRGLRNAVFLALNPVNDKVYVTEMGRDFLGNTTPPDEINILEVDKNYGWPYCYGKKIWDRVFGQRNQEYCNTTIPSFYEIPAHSAPLGLTFIKSNQFPENWQHDLLVAYHGSWNSSVPVGYKIVRITTDNQPQEFDFLTGFSNTTARPVDVIFDKEGSLFISDDKANMVYKAVKVN